MQTHQEIEAWHQIKHLVEEKHSYLLTHYLKTLTASETARAISMLDKQTKSKLLSMLPPESSADMLLDLVEEQAIEMLDTVSNEQAATILEELPSNAQADLLSDLTDDRAAAILQELPAVEAEQARLLLQYPEDTAGGIMATEYLAFPESMLVNQLLSDLERNHEKYSDYEVQYAFVESASGSLAGVLPLRSVLFASRSTLLRDLMISEPIYVKPDTTLTELIDLFEDHDFLGVPVLEDSRIIGLVHRADVMEASQDRESDSFLKASGIVGGDELRSMPLLHRSRRRLSWLSINIVLNIIAASVIVFYEDTLASIISLAVFLPIISDMSGCSGNQAVAVSIRELTLGITKPFEIVRVFIKEFGVGIINGVVLGALLGLAAVIWKGNPYFGIVIGGAMLINTVVAVCLGGLIPLVLSRWGKDPALASGPLLTTVTDMCGFFLALTFASIMLPLLQA